MVRATISGIGSYAPERVVTNDYFDRLYGRDMDTFLREKRNIQQRHWMAEDQRTSDLILPAAAEAIEHAGLTPDDLDLILVATDTPDYISPATAVVVQHKLGAKKAGAFDLNAACAGFVTALDVADKYIRMDTAYRHILVVGAYGMSKHLDFEDYKVASLFADGAGAVVVSATAEDQGILASLLRSDGQYHDYMGIYAGGTAEPFSEEALNSNAHKLKFLKKIPSEMNGKVWPELVHSVLDRAGSDLQDLDLAIFTQINIESITQAMANLGLPMTKTHNVMKQFGYTGSACIPMALYDAYHADHLHPGDLVTLVGSGGGVAMAALAFRWGLDK